MSKKWMYLFVLAILVVPLLLTACGPTAEPTAAPEPTQAEVQATAGARGANCRSRGTEGCRPLR
jgi:hypothetical protein